MKVSNCCGSFGMQIISVPEIVQAKDVDICGLCGEHCEYVEEEDTSVRDMMQQIHKNYPNLDYVSQAYRDYNGQIKKQDD